MPERRVASYKPQEVSVIVGPHIITGFAKGTFINVSYEEDAAAYHAGLANGAVVVNPNREGNLELTVIQTSVSNGHLQTYISRLRDGSGIFYFPMYVVNNSGGELASADSAFITKEPAITFSDGLENRVWTFKTGNLTMNHEANYEVINEV